MTTIELKNTGKIKVFTWQELPNVAWALVGKSQKPSWQYRFKSIEQRDSYVNEWTVKTQKHLDDYEAHKIERREKAKLERKQKNSELHSKIKVGSFMKNAWGTTMHRVNWFEVVAIEGNLIYLGMAHFVDNSGGYSGYSTLMGPGDKQVIAYAKIMNGRIALLEKRSDGKLTSSRSYWGSCYLCNVGDREYVFCD